MMEDMETFRSVSHLIGDVEFSGRRRLWRRRLMGGGGDNQSGLPMVAKLRRRVLADLQEKCGRLRIRGQLRSFSRSGLV